MTQILEQQISCSARILCSEMCLQVCGGISYVEQSSFFYVYTIMLQWIYCRTSCSCFSPCNYLMFSCFGTKPLQQKRPSSSSQSLIYLFWDICLGYAMLEKKLNYEICCFSSAKYRKFHHIHAVRFSCTGILSNNNFADCVWATEKQVLLCVSTESRIWEIESDTLVLFNLICWRVIR